MAHAPSVAKLGELAILMEQEHKRIVVTDYSLVRVVLTETVTQIILQ